MQKTIHTAQSRVGSFVNRTPIFSSQFLNQQLGQEIFFKMENMQKVGAFKARGALNAILQLQAINPNLKEVVCNSLGNHAQGLAWAARELNIKATVFMEESSSVLKQQATRSYGANLIITKNKKESEQLLAKKIEAGVALVHGFDNQHIIEGQATACYEALEDLGFDPDAIFVPCGGGGLAAGSYMACKEMQSKAKLFFAEPLRANDACCSYRSGKIFSLDASPNTIADGVRTFSVSDLTFKYLKEFDGFFEVFEEEIIYWTQWLTHLLKSNIEPSSALAMAAAFKWLEKTHLKQQKILVIISGGNISAQTQRSIWQEDFLSKVPSLNMPQAV